MFMRYLDPSNPANRDKDTTLHARAIEELYVKMDGLLARVMEHVDDKTLLCVVSDHGFKQFKRGVNINTWALENGYMKVKGGEADGNEAGGEADGEACDLGGYCAGVAGSGSAIGEYLRGVDWSQTRIYQLGLSGIYINKKGREARGLVRSDEYKALKKEIVEKLEGLRDPDTGEVAITSVYDTKEIMNGPYADGAPDLIIGYYADGAPDLIIGYNVGYRASWDAAVGKSSEAVLEDNLKSWSGDHCIDYKLVPGVLFTNRKVVADRPGLIDMGPSILDLFGVKVPDFMMGRSIFRGGGASDAAGDGPAQDDRGSDQMRAREDS
jgi:predicted AlkP superfamily phosphohydrolase/phosphomutase